MSGIDFAGGGGGPALLARGREGCEEAEILLSELLKKAGVVAKSPLYRDPEISGISFDSRNVKAGDLFVGLPGRNFDGGVFAIEAIERGAMAVIVEPSALEGLGGVRDVVVIAHDTPNRMLLADLSLGFYGDVSSQLALVGVTGTNGKTTVTHLIAHICSQLGRQSSVIGTLNGERTTPESAELFSRLGVARDSGDLIVAMEVSSIALDQERVRNLHFRASVFMNLSPDHLDYHGSMAAYFAAKARLFTPQYSSFGIINRDSAYGKALLGGATISTLGFGMDDVGDILSRSGVTSFTYRGARFSTSLFGRHNIYNLLGAIESARELGFGLSDIAEVLPRFGGVPGRLERINPGALPAAYVDYAHSPDALEQVIAALGGIKAAEARVIVVFGAGGNRDRSKRALMGAVVSANADYAIVTNDNPRDEDPGAIVASVVAGFVSGNSGFGYEVIYDRAAAIARAIELARDIDIILVAGKGHETYQQIGSTTTHFSDQETLAGLLGLDLPELP